MRQILSAIFRTTMMVFVLAATIASSHAAAFTTSVPGAELLQQIFGMRIENAGVTRWGVSYSLVQESRPIGRAIIGVFPSPNRAKKLFDDRVRHTPVPPTNAQGSMVGNQSAQWDGRVVFIRDNVFVEVEFPGSDVGEKARALDIALRDGSAGVKKGNEVGIPTLEGLEYSPSGWKATVASTVPGYTALVDRFGMETRSENAATEAYFATEGCVMSEPLKCEPSDRSAKREAAKTNEAKDERLTPEAQRQQVKTATATLRDKGSSPSHRNKAVVVLGNAGNMEAVPILLAELAEGTDPVVKQNAIAAIGRLRAKQAVPDLLKMLDSPITGNVSDEGEWKAIFRREAAKALGRIGDPSALVTLRKAMDASYEYQSVRDAAKTAIRMIEKPLEP